MKKFFLLLALILIFSVTACGKKSENTTTPEQNDADETAETEQNDNDTDSDSDSEHDEDALENDEDDDTTRDTDQNDGDTEIPVYPDSDLPECAQRGKTPCKDSTTGLMWSSMYYDNWHQTKCGEISDGGYTDWLVPKISQLMTLVQNCPDFENGGCETSLTSKYSRLGDTETLWSGSIKEAYFLAINFSNASIEAHCNAFLASLVEGNGYPPYDCYECFESHYLRCTRCDEGYFWYGGERGCDNVKPAFGNICTGLRKCLEGETENCMDVNEYSAYYDYSDMYYAERGKCAPQNFSIDSSVPGQETVADNNLGLEWQRNFTLDRYAWDDAVEYCDTLSYGGHSDWRLPDLHEIFSVVFNSDIGDLLDWRLFPKASKETKLWTSQLSSEYYDYVWYINSFGTIDYAGKSYLANVMCVRGERLPKASFKTTTVGEDAVVTDTTTGLMWQMTPYTARADWESTVSYCENLTYAGYSDWRLPNKNELLSLVDYDKYYPATEFPDEYGRAFSTSSPNVRDPHYIWVVYLDSGYVTTEFHKDNSTSSIYVRCVR